MRPVTLIAIAILLAAALTLFLHLSVTDEEFSRYNIGWTGTSSFFATLDRHTMQEIDSPSDLPPATGETLLVIAPDRNVTGDDGILYRDFIARGNTLFLADDFGTGNTLLGAINSSITIRQENLSSLDRAYKDPSMIVVSAVKTSRYLAGGKTILLDHAGSLSGGDPLLETTIFSWGDEVPDGKLSPNESLGRYTVMAQEFIGNGTLYVLSDPSVFINGMEDPGYDNQLFRSAVARSGPVLIDGYSSRVVREGLTGEFIHSLRSSTLYTFAAAALLTAGILIAWNRRIL